MSDISESILPALYLGIVEGLTEFIPVSSTGHLILFSSHFDYTSPQVATFEIFIQLGAILAVLVLYRQRFVDLLSFSSLTDTGLKGNAGLFKIFCACLPAFVLGALFHDSIKEFLFKPTPVAWALIVGGILMWIVEYFYRTPRVNRVEEITLQDAFVIGVFQCLALWPGMSRSGSTIIGGLAVGLDKRVAAEFSFIVAVPVMVAATSFELLKSWSSLQAESLLPFATGFFVSFLTAVIAIKFFMAILHRFKLAVFSVYRILLGALVLIMMS